MTRRIGHGPAAACAAVSLWLALAARHAFGYFLLADDHALVAEGAGSTLATIVRTPMFGVYRPLGFVVAHVAGAFSPTHAGWSAVVLAMHAANAALLGALALRLGYGTGIAAFSAVLFLWSPWGSEAYLWFSGVFDVGATMGVLMAAVALAGAGTPGAARRISLPLAVAGCLIAAGFKENGYLAAVLAPLLALSGDRQKLSRTIVLTALIAAACATGIFVYRTNLLATVATPYSVSEFGSRLLAIEALPAVASNPRALLLWPAPAIWGDASRLVSTGVLWPAAATLVSGLVVLALAQRPRSWLQFAALGLSLAPTASFRFDVATITPRRYLYLAGISLCLLLSSGLSSRAHTTGRPSTTAARLAMVLGIGLAILSSLHQFGLWRAVSATARCAMHDFHQQVIVPRLTGPVLVENMPFAVEYGPFILLEYDFRHAYGDRWGEPHVAFRRTTLALDPRGALTVQGRADEPSGVAAGTRISLDLCLRD